ncbi:MAG: preprotein translocase subunit SecG [Bacteroidota bacterium]|jgi:preprotein translocase subunit SecG
MSGFLTVLIILVCILLIIVVLIQNSKGGGIASNFAASNQVMGVQKTSEVIEKITWGLAISLVVLSIAASFVYKSGTSAIQKESELKEKIENTKSKPIQNFPSGAAKPAPAPAGK